MCRPSCAGTGTPGHPARIRVAGARAWCRQAEGLLLVGRARESHLHKGEFDGRNPRKGSEGIGTAIHGQWLDPGVGGQVRILCGFRLLPHHPQLSFLPPCPNLHLCIPAVIVDRHLLIKGLPTVVRRVHLGTGWRACSGSSHMSPLPHFPPFPAPG